MIDDERFSQAAIERLTPVEPSAQLRRLVAQIPIEHPRTEKSWWPFSSVFFPSLSMAAVALFGLFLGHTWEPGAIEGAPSTVARVDRASDADGSSSATDVAALTDETARDPLAGETDEMLEDLLILATAADFEPDDWDLSRERESEPTEETF